jgi:hypothetical protein
LFLDRYFKVVKLAKNSMELEMQKMRIKKTDSVADILERELVPTITDWLRRVNLVPELTGTPLSDADRTGHLPKLLTDLISRLRLTDKSKPPISAAATAHGKVRYQQGYSPCMLVEESRVFQVSTFNTLQIHQNELDQSQVLLDVMTIADEVDAQLKETMRSLMEEMKVAVAA